MGECPPHQTRIQTTHEKTKAKRRRAQTVQDLWSPSLRVPQLCELRHRTQRIRDTGYRVHAKKPRVCGRSVFLCGHDQSGRGRAFSAAHPRHQECLAHRSRVWSRASDGSCPQPGTRAPDPGTCPGKPDCTTTEVPGFWRMEGLTSLRPTVSRLTIGTCVSIGRRAVENPRPFKCVLRRIAVFGDAGFSVLSNNAWQPHGCRHSGGSPLRRVVCRPPRKSSCRVCCPMRC